MKRKCQWVIMNGLFVACLVFGIFKNAEWAKNIVIFLSWVMLIIVFIAIFNEEALKKIRKEGPSINNQSFMVVYDSSIIIIMIGAGWIITGIVYMISFLCEQYIFWEKPKEDSDG